MPATPLESVGLTHVGDASIFEQWDGFHEINDTFELIKNDTDRVLLSISETAGCDLNLDTTIQPKSTSTAHPLIVNNAAGSLLLDVYNQLVASKRTLHVYNTNDASSVICRYAGSDKLNIDTNGSLVNPNNSGVTLKGSDVYKVDLNGTLVNTTPPSQNVSTS